MILFLYFNFGSIIATLTYHPFWFLTIILSLIMLNTFDYTPQWTQTSTNWQRSLKQITFLRIGTNKNISSRTYWKYVCLLIQICELLIASPNGGTLSPVSWNCVCFGQQFRICWQLSNYFDSEFQFLKIYLSIFLKVDVQQWKGNQDHKDIL